MTNAVCSVLVTSVATTSKLATSVTGACFSAVYHVRMYPASNALVRSVIPHCAGARPVSMLVFPCMTITARMMIDPIAMRAPATSMLERFLSAFFAMMLSIAQRNVAARTINSPIPNVKFGRPKRTRLPPNRSMRAAI